MNYYNDNEPTSAAWIRQLVVDGLIPPGDVDGRSILEVQPEDLRKYTQCHFFAGIAGWSHALDLAEWPPTTTCWTGSCPCQPFSTAGKQSGLGDKRHLWPEFFRLIKACSPDIILGEQVPAAINMGWLDEVFNNLEEAGYATHAIILPSSSVGAPHIRSRLYWSAKLHANQVHWDSSCLKILKTRFVPNIGMSPEYVHTWKTKKTPGGRVVHYLSAGRSTNKAGWPTPTAIEQRETSEAKVARGAHAGLNLSVAAKMAGWGTPRVSDGTLAETTRLPPSGTRSRLELEVLTVLDQAAELAVAGWPTPRTRDDLPETVENWTARNVRKSENPKLGAIHKPLNIVAQLAAGWPTPQEDNANNAYGHKGTVFSDLPTTAQTAGWPTPMAGNPGTDTYNPAGNTDSSRKTVALLTGWKHAPTH